MNKINFIYWNLSGYIGLKSWGYDWSIMILKQLMGTKDEAIHNTGIRITDFCSSVLYLRKATFYLN